MITEMTLPAWIDPEAWAEYAAMRSRIKRPLTARMVRQKLARCAELRDAGYDVTACIDAATEAQWLDFYAPRDKTILPSPEQRSKIAQQEIAERHRNAAAAAAAGDRRPAWLRGRMAEVKQHLTGLRREDEQRPE